MSNTFETYLKEIRACTLCKGDMPRDPKPVLQVSETATILIAGQAPGNLAAESGIPFSDPSGKRLREWMGVTDDEFYDPSRVAVVPMGFCFPGNDAKGGDIPPMKRCAETWRAGLMQRLPNLQVTLLIGAYAQRWHLGSRAKKTLTETVKQWRELTSEQMFTTPHPSWRNTGWLKRNPWFETDVLPELRAAVRSALD
jgi:uracil-DNA glycosylase